MNRCSALLAALLAIYGSTAQATTQEDLERTAEQYDSLENDLNKLQEQMLSEMSAQPSAKHLAYDYLNSCANIVTSTSRAITSMTQVLRMSQFVWDPTARRLAKPYIDIQIRALVKQLDLSTRHLEQRLSGSRNEQVSKLCLRSRDLTKSSIPIVSELQPSWKASQ